MNKKSMLLISALLSSALIVGCSGDSNEVKKNEDSKVEVFNEKENKENEPKNNEEELNKKTEEVKEEEKKVEEKKKEVVEEIKEDIYDIKQEAKTIMKEELQSMDFDLFYFMDGDIDFLEMKGAGKKSKDKAYYEEAYPMGDSFEVRFYTGADRYTINKISLLAKKQEEGTIKQYEYERSFMGLYIGMPMELASEYMEKSSSEYDGELEVNYYDYSNDGVVDRIDVISKKEIVLREQREDFYLKFFGRNMHDYAGNMGNGTGAKQELKVDKENKTYTYLIKYGEDEYNKTYTYDEKEKIKTMELTSNKERFIGVSPSLFGIKLGEDKSEIENKVSQAGKQIHSKKEISKNIEEYIVLEPESKMLYTAQIEYDSADKVVKIKGAIKERELVERVELLDLVGTKLEGENLIIEGEGSEQWEVGFEAYGDKLIRSVAIHPVEGAIYVDKVPSLLGVHFNMTEANIEIALNENGYEVLNKEDNYSFADKNIKIAMYTIKNIETQQETMAYFTVKYMGSDLGDLVIGMSM